MKTKIVIEVHCFVLVLVLLIVTILLSA